MGDLLRAVICAAVLAVIARYLLSFARSARTMFAEWHMSDFGKFYYATRAFLEGQPMYGASPATATVLDPGLTIQLWDMNPPHFHLIILPIASLSPKQAILAWATVSAVGLLASVHVIVRELDVRYTAAGAVWTLLAILAFSATATTLISGQLTFVVLLPMTLAWAAARRGRWTRAASWLGLAASIKPFLALFFVYLIIERRVKEAAVFLGVVVATTLAGLLVFGWRAYVDWVHVLSSITWFWTPMNVSVTGLLARTFDDSAFFTPIVRMPWLIRPVAAIAAIGVAAATLAVMARDRSAEAPDRAFAGILLASLMISPLGSVYYLWFAAAPCLALWLRFRSGRSRMRDVLILLSLPGLVWPVVMTTLWGHNPFAGVTIGSIYTWTTALLWMAVLIEGRSRAPSAPLVPRDR